MDSLRMYKLLVVFGIFASQPSYGQTLDMRTSFVPAPVMIEGNATLYYELYVTNHSADTLQLKSLTVQEEKGSLPWFTSKDNELTNRLGSADVGRRRQPSGNLAPGDSIVVYIECSLPNDKTGVTLYHKLEFRSRNGEQQFIEGAPISLSAPSKISLGNPLRGGPWCAVYEPSWETGHRRKIFAVGGKSRIPGRFAIDFMKLDEKGRYTVGNEDSIAGWFGYGADVLAVADGMIITVRDTFTESPTLSGHPKYPADKATGNYICLKIGENEFVFYEHLKPGSIRVVAGQSVKKGVVIASLGFTGQSTGPHLHLHVANDSSPLGSEGISFVLESFELLGAYDNFDDFGKSPWTSLSDKQAKKRKAERPPPNSIISFRQLDGKAPK
jgi:murein DD-endopeptidase